MAVGLLEQAEKEIQLSNRDNRKGSYSDTCIRDSQNLDAKTRDAIYKYTVDSRPFNNRQEERLYCSPVNEGISESIRENSVQEERCNLLDQYLHAERLPMDLPLFRGTSLERFCDKIVFNDVDKEIFLNDCKTVTDGDKLTEKYGGQVFTYKQRVSTSVDSRRVLDFLRGPTQCMLNIVAPKGAFARCIRDVSEYPTENEVLLPCDTKFRIIEIRSHEKIHDIYVEVVVDQQTRNTYDIGNGYD